MADNTQPNRSPHVDAGSAGAQADARYRADARYHAEGQDASGRESVRSMEGAANARQSLPERGQAGSESEPRTEAEWRMEDWPTERSDR